MAELTPDILNQVVETITGGAAEAAEALARGLDAQGIQVQVGAPGTFDAKALPPGFDGPGLAVVLTVGASAALALLPDSSGMLPPWGAQPDATGESKLTTLAQELGMILLPEALMPTEFKAGWVKTLAGAVARGGVDDGAAMVPLELVLGEKQATLSLIWPATKPSFVVGAASKPAPAAEKPKPAPASKPAASAKPAAAPGAAAKTGSRPAARPGELPTYSQSLLRIKVPVVVTLAKKRQSLGRIVEIGPGSILQFDKSCEEMLELDVGSRPVATGEAVKVGDKFGLRVTSIVMPEERFKPVGTKG